MTNVLEINNLSKHYDSFSLKNINMVIPKGSIMGLVGENGAGKTTTIKSILNIINKDSGDIKILGLDSINDELEVKEKIGVVLDESYFHDNLNSKDINKIMKNIYKNWDENLFFSYLDKLNLPKEKIVKEYSKGMKMKLSIAAALSHNPEFLILDEPTSGLDPVSRNELLDIFLEFIQDENKSILFSTHITSDLDRVADYITFINKGEIVFSLDKFDVLDKHIKIKCSLEDFEKIPKENIINFRKTGFGYEVLLNREIDFDNLGINHVKDQVNLEEIMLFYIRGDKNERTFN